MSEEPFTLADVQGFQFNVAAAGLRADGAPEVALITSQTPCAGAALFTRNLVRAAPVLYDEALLRERGEGYYGVVINAKNANAVTGEQGLRDAATMAALAEQGTTSPPRSFFVMSTGVIGVPMPMEKIGAAVARAAADVGASPARAAQVARAIMTTDTYPKQAGVRLPLGESVVTLAGVAKGAGMIHPDMATMLGVILTDANITPAALDTALRYAVERSYHCISVDGDSSTNDTQLVLANALAANALITDERHPDFAAFRDALTALCVTLAKAIAFDGEGASKAVTIEVQGCRTFDDARRIGRTIATSPLVKTAIYGRDANWGRVLAAAGRTGVDFDPNAADLWFGDLQLLAAGTPVGVDETRALAILSEREVTITLRLNAGAESATVWTCDLTEGYIQVNADYRT